MAILASKVMDEMLPLVGKKRTPDLESSDTEGMAISSISGGLMMLFPFSGLFSSLFWEKKISSTGCFKMENPGAWRRLSKAISV